MTFVVLSTDDSREADTIVAGMNFTAAIEREMDHAAIELATTQDRVARMRAFDRLKRLHAMRPLAQVRRMEAEQGLS